MRKNVLFAMFFAFFGLNLLANDKFIVENIYARQTPPNAQTSAIFLNFKNNSDKDVAILAASCDAANVTELHTHTNENGKMSMVKVPQIIIPAHSSVELKPGSFHIMLIDLKQKIDENTRVNLVLYLSDNTTLSFANIISKSVMMHKNNASKPMKQDIPMH